MPLPCSPASMSTGEDTSASFSQCSEDELVTPRPGPSSPEQRTQAILSRPAKPSPEAFIRPNSFKEWQTDNIRERPETEDEEIDRAIERAHASPNPPSFAALGSSQFSGIITVACIAPTKERPASIGSNPSQQSGSSSSHKRPGKPIKRSPASTASTCQLAGDSDKQRSVSFHPSSFKMAAPGDAAISPGTSFKDYLSSKRGSPRSSVIDQRLHEDQESSADENTAIFRHRSTAKIGVGTSVSYGATVPSTLRRTRSGNDESQQAEDYDAAAEEDTRETRRGKANSPVSTKAGQGTITNTGAATSSSTARARRRSDATKSNDDNDNDNPIDAGRADADKASTGGGKESWWARTVEKYGSVELENKGSVARDHLALERTFLAWLRTSLSFASIGIAITQLFRLNSALRDGSQEKRSVSAFSSSSSSSSTAAAYAHLPQGVIVSSSPDGSRIHESPFLTALATAPELRRLSHIGKPLGATFLGVAVLILLVGFHRYFEGQHYVIRGKFPASRGSIVLVSAVAGALIIASLVVIVWIAPAALAGGDA